MNPDLDFRLAERRHAADVAAAERRAGEGREGAWRLRLPAIDVTIRLEIQVGRGAGTPAAPA